LIYLIVIGLVFAFTLVVWNLLHIAPRRVAMLLPERVCLIMGSILLPFGIFSAFIAAFRQQNAEGMIASIVVAYVGLWFMLIKPAASGSYELEQMIRRLFTMMALLMAALIATLHLGESRFVALINLVLVTGGFLYARDYLRYLDRGR
jgi:hypothetical protein